MHEYIALQLHEDRAARLRAEAAADRLARSAVRQPENLPSRRPWWHRLILGRQQANAVSRHSSTAASVRPA
jgi:hypothetical protein